MSQERPIAEIRFSGSVDLTRRIDQLLLEPTAQATIDSCHPLVLTGLSRTPPDRALYHFLSSRGLYVERTYYIDINSERTSIVEDGSRGVEIPATVLDDPNNFYREVVWRIRTFVGSRDDN